MHFTIKTLTVVLCSFIFLTACDQNQNTHSSQGIISSSLQALQRDSQPGAALVKKKCISCHYLNRHLTKVGPSLKGIFGHAPSISGVPFAIWNEKTLDQWLANPTGIKPNTLMAMPGIKSRKQRKAIIDYLKQI